jgi:hypothetical protein
MRAFNEKKAKTKLNDKYATVHDTILLALIALVHASSKHCVDDSNQSAKDYQSNWLEVLIDTALHIHENSSINANTNQDLVSRDDFQFLHEIFKHTSLLTYFLSHIALYAMKFHLSSFLTDFIYKCHVESMGLLDDQYTASNLSTYIISTIHSTVDFSFKLNDNINKLIENFYELYLNANKQDAHLVGLTKTLCSLYDEDSAFYDEKCILKRILNQLCHDDDNANDTNTLCEVILTCIAYKSNMIENESILLVYEKLKKVCVFFLFYQLFFS